MVARTSVNVLQNDKTNKKEYKNLVEALLVLTILFNRRRIGDVQYTKLKTYTNPQFSLTNLEECKNALSESEKILTKYYKRIVTGGKGSKPITILFPPEVRTFLDFALQIRSETTLVQAENDYLFPCPGTLKWLRGDIVMRKFALKADLQYPNEISSNKLRKQIA